MLSAVTPQRVTTSAESMALEYDVEITSTGWRMSSCVFRPTAFLCRRLVICLKHQLRIWAGTQHKRTLCRKAGRVATYRSHCTSDDIQNQEPVETCAFARQWACAPEDNGKYERDVQEAV